MTYNNSSLKAKEEYSDLSDYYKDLYRYLRKLGYYMWGCVKNEEFSKTPKNSLEKILEFHNLMGVIKKEAEKDYSNYWRNGVINLCDSMRGRIINKLLKYLKIK